MCNITYIFEFWILKSTYNYYSLVLKKLNQNTIFFFFYHKELSKNLTWDKLFWTAFTFLSTVQQV